jgi:hypothetical protein
VVGILVPPTTAVESGAKPVPVSVTGAAVFTRPEFGEMEVSVGTGGLEIVIVIALDVAGVEVALLTVTVAVPGDDSKLAGTVATTNSEPGEG